MCLLSLCCPHSCVTPHYLITHHFPVIPLSWYPTCLLFHSPVTPYTFSAPTLLSPHCPGASPHYPGTTHTLLVPPTLSYYPHPHTLLLPPHKISLSRNYLYVSLITCVNLHFLRQNIILEQILFTRNKHLSLLVAIPMFTSNNFNDQSFSKNQLNHNEFKQFILKV